VPQGVRVRVSPPAQIFLKSMNTVDNLLDLLKLKKKEDYFLGISKTIGSNSVFGGQVLAQSLYAAYSSIDNRILHSLHSYFLERGDLEIPIKYYVDQIRDGGSFSTRRVTAKQKDKTIFIMAASFQKKEAGHKFYKKITNKIKQPEELLTTLEIKKKYGLFMSKKLKSFLSVERPVEFKPIQRTNPILKKNIPPKLDVWFRIKGEISFMTLDLKQQILTYVSDYNILSTTLFPHLTKADFSNTIMASLDHSMYFYRDFDFSDWLLYRIESPSTSNARGLSIGHIYSRDGFLVATAIQEGLIRPLKK
tara:strand:+ start:6633 stop:7550 length:918 start_codon:yes stop_codon:yes gene_type:complete